MKRLLIAPLLIALALPKAVNAFPFDNDIVVKTDLGEKYIVKKSALYIEEKFDEVDFISLVSDNILNENKSRFLRLQAAVDKLKREMVRSPEKYRNCLRSNTFTKKDCNYMYLSEEFISDNQDRLNYVEINLNEVTYEIEQKIKNETKDPFIGTHAVMIRFRPIFENLNNQKEGLDYTKIICLNPKLKDQTYKKWAKKYSDNYFNPNSSLAMNSLKKKVCKKYAKFK